MQKNYAYNLIQTVINLSEADNWEDAVEEWNIEDCEEDVTATSKCICGKEAIRYLYTIKNAENGNGICPIGSSCIKKFQRKDLRESLTLIESQFKLLHAIEQNQFLTLSSDLFSRKLLKWLYEEGAFDTPYNHFDGEDDYDFMLKMFNMRDKTKITDGQQRKTTAILLNSIRPFMMRQLINKVHENGLPDNKE